MLENKIKILTNNKNKQRKTKEMGYETYKGEDKYDSSKAKKITRKIGHMALFDRYDKI
ncbi:hypothetical protein IKF67_02190 [Candidatus Saccharibacteria bacterium]|nr:hypothetical protein [Candidatus Saccharibacteria bacterium]